jgi:hypothetical protein
MSNYQDRSSLFTLGSTLFKDNKGFSKLRAGCEDDETVDRESNRDRKERRLNILVNLQSSLEILIESSFRPEQVSKEYGRK